MVNKPNEDSYWILIRTSHEGLCIHRYPKLIADIVGTSAQAGNHNYLGKHRITGKCNDEMSTFT